MGDVDNKRDTRPDKFTYKLPGGGGSGYFSDRSSPLITVPHNSDVVRYAESDMNITDGNGVKYLFNGVHETMNDIITRWMCTSICSAVIHILHWLVFSIKPFRINGNLVLIII